MKFNMIGTGRLGKNIALALSTANLASLQAVYNLHKESAEQSCHELGIGRPLDKIEDLPWANITWITCNDDSIASIVETLANLSLIKPGSFLIHCSGVFDSTLLAPLKKQGCSIASFHPLKAFKTGYVDAQAFQYTDCVIEGDEEVCTWLRSSFSQLGANILAIRPQDKAIYHAAACMASNYLITLATCSEQLFLKAGIPPKQARQMVCKLMQGNINNLQQNQPIAESLTGPLVRGDNKTLSLHLKAIEDSAIKTFYKAAGLATLPLTQLTKEKKEIVESLFVF